VIGFPRALGEVFDLVIFDGNLGPKKPNFVVFLANTFCKLFKVVAPRRARARLGVRGRRLYWWRDFVNFRAALGRVRARRGASSRGQGVANLRDVAVNQFDGDEVFFAELGFSFSAIKVAAGAILLNAPERAGNAGLLVPLGGFLYSQGRGVWGRVRARRGGGHALKDNAVRLHLSPVIPNGATMSKTKRGLDCY